MTDGKFTLGHAQGRTKTEIVSDPQARAERDRFKEEAKREKARADQILADSNKAADEWRERIGETRTARDALSDRLALVAAEWRKVPGQTLPAEIGARLRELLADAPAPLAPTKLLIRERDKALAAWDAEKVRADKAENEIRLRNAARKCDVTQILLLESEIERIATELAAEKAQRLAAEKERDQAVEDLVLERVDHALDTSEDSCDENASDSKSDSSAEPSDAGAEAPVVTGFRVSSHLSEGVHLVSGTEVAAVLQEPILGELARFLSPDEPEPTFESLAEDEKHLTEEDRKALDALGSLDDILAREKARTDADAARAERAIDRGRLEALEIVVYGKPGGADEVGIPDRLQCVERGLRTLTHIVLGDPNRVGEGRQGHDHKIAALGQRLAALESGGNSSDPGGSSSSDPGRSCPPAEAAGPNDDDQEDATS